MDKTDMFQHHLWELEERIEKYKDLVDRNYLRILALKRQIKEQEKTSQKQVKHILIKKGGKLDNFTTRRLVRKHDPRYNFPDKNHHYQLIGKSNRALIINDTKLYDALLNVVTKDDIKKGITLRIKRSAKDRYYIWIIKRF